jgi:membrane-bound lytic murein transglycosylase A
LSHRARAARTACCAGPFDGTFDAPREGIAAGICAALVSASLLALTGCQTHPPAAAAGASPTPPGASAPAGDAGGSASGGGQPPGPSPDRNLPGAWPHGHALWVPAGFDDLPGWAADATAQGWPALQLGCQQPARPWATLCADALRFTPASDALARQWLEQRLRVYRVESPDGDPTGLATGYFEPLVEASRRAQGRFRIPLYAPPADLSSRKPYWTRQQLDTDPAAQRALRGREIAFVEDPLDALLLQVQGSGRLQVTEPDGSRHLVRLAFAAHNGQPYRSVGRWLIEQGALKASDASWPGIKAWAQRNPKRLNDLLWSNPRTVFFREEPLPDPALGPKGAQGVPLTPGRSVAVDPQSVPYGTPLWIDTTEPLSDRPLQRLVMAQDTGSAINGAVRIDYFWGWGDDALAQAGRMKQALKVWALWPR